MPVSCDLRVRELSAWVAVALVVVVAACGGESNDKEDPAPTLFAKLNSERSGVTFANALHPTEDLNIITYLYYYNGGGIAAGDVDGDGLVDLFFTSNQGDNTLYRNLGGLRFEEVTDAAGIRRSSGWSTGTSFTDFDGDGDLDLYVCKVDGVAGLTGRNELYVNDGTGRFTERAAEYGLDFAGLSTQAAFFDADGDGDLDVYLLNHSTHPTAQQRDTSARRTADPYAGDRLYLQNAGGTFDDATAGSGLLSSRLGYGLGLAVADFGGDFSYGLYGPHAMEGPHLPDIYVGNDFSEEDYLYQNLGGGLFRKTRWLPSSSMFSMGNAAADLDADGTLDLLTLDMRPYSDSVRKSSAGGDDLPGMKGKLRAGFGLQFAKNAALLNRGGQFVDAAVQLGIHSTDWSWAPAVLDADLDGRPDIVVGNGIVRRPNDLDYLKYSSGEAIQRRATNLELASLMPAGLVPNRAFRGAADGPFKEVSKAWGLDLVGSTTALIAVDLDNDGDEDIVTNNVNAPAVIFENRSLGAVGGFGREPGVRVSVFDSVGSPFVGARFVVRQGTWQRGFAVQPVTGFQSSVLAPIVVGLPRPNDTFRLVIQYPGGYSELRSGLRGDQVVLAKAGPPPPLEERWEPHVTGDFSASPDLYRAFDADPLSPVYPPAKPSAADLRIFEAKLGFGPAQRRQLWSAVDSLLLSSCINLSDGTALLGGLWMPVLRVRLLEGRTASVRFDTLAPAGLWVGVTEVIGRPGQFVFANVGLNTLLAENPRQQIELHVADFDRNGEEDPILVRVDSSGRTTMLGLDALAGQMPTMRRFFSSYLPFSASRFDRLFPPAEQLGGRVLRAGELRSYVYDAGSSEAVPLAFGLQTGTPASVSYDAERREYSIEYRSPPMRPELMAYGNYTLLATSLK